MWLSHKATQLRNELMDVLVKHEGIPSISDHIQAAEHIHGFVVKSCPILYAKYKLRPDLVSVDLMHSFGWETMIMAWGDEGIQIRRPGNLETLQHLAIPELKKAKGLSLDDHELALLEIESDDPVTLCTEYRKYWEEKQAERLQTPALEETKSTETQSPMPMPKVPSPVVPIAILKRKTSVGPSPTPKEKTHKKQKQDLVDKFEEDMAAKAEKEALEADHAQAPTFPQLDAGFYRPAATVAPAEPPVSKTTKAPEAKVPFCRPVVRVAPAEAPVYEKARVPSPPRREARDKHFHVSYPQIAPAEHPVPEKSKVAGDAGAGLTTIAGRKISPMPRPVNLEPAPRAPVVAPGGRPAGSGVLGQWLRPQKMIQAAAPKTAPTAGKAAENPAVPASRRLHSTGMYVMDQSESETLWIKTFNRWPPPEPFVVSEIPESVFDAKVSGDDNSIWRRFTRSGLIPPDTRIIYDDGPQSRTKRLFITLKSAKTPRSPESINSLRMMYEDIMAWMEHGQSGGDLEDIDVFIQQRRARARGAPELGTQHVQSSGMLAEGETQQSMEEATGYSSRAG